MGMCQSADSVLAKEEQEASNEELRPESSFYGRITQHNPKDSMGQSVTVQDKYDFDEDLELGASSTGVVCKAVRKSDGQEFALKVIHLDKIDEVNRDQLRSEIDILKSLDHPNIVKLFETFEQDNVLYMIMELCTGGELYGRLSASGKRFAEPVVSRICKQMLSAVVYCHSKKIAHRDIKMANFLFKDDSPDAPVKMIDFGYSKMMYKMGNQRLETFVGTSYFIAPEVIRGTYSEKADIWSIGVMCFLMVVGYAPFRGKTGDDVIESVKKGKINWNTPRWRQASRGCLSFTQALLTVKESKRLSAEEALKHPWLSESTEQLVPNFSDQMLVNMSNFADTAGLKKLAKVVIAHSAHRDYVQPYHDAFFAIDHDHSGRIDKDEMVAALMEHNGLDKNTAEGIFDAIDYDGNGTIRFSEFVGAAIGDTFTDAHIEDAFKRLCHPGSAPVTPATPGSLVSDEEGVPMQRVKTVSNSVITPESLHEAYDEHDIETCTSMIIEAGDGRRVLNYEDFARFMRSADSIVLDDDQNIVSEANANAPSFGGPGSPSNGARKMPGPVLMKKQRDSASRPELIRKISGVVANKPSSNRRRESLKLRQDALNASLTAESTDGVDAQKSLDTIYSARTTSTRSSLADDDSGIPVSSEQSARQSISAAGAFQLGRSAGRQFSQMQQASKSSTDFTSDQAKMHNLGFEAGKASKFTASDVERAGDEGEGTAETPTLRSVIPSRDKTKSVEFGAMDFGSLPQDQVDAAVATPK